MIRSNSAAATLSEIDERPACCAGSTCCAGPKEQQPHSAPPIAHIHHGTVQDRPSLNRTAFMATLHCLTGCAIGEVLGLMIGTALGWSNWPTVALAVVLAFLVGYGMTLWPLRKSGMAWGAALGLALASDTLSMGTMELVDNAIMLVVPGAMNAGLSDPLFWGSLVLSMILAGMAAFPVNRWLIAQGKGHALVHGQHCH